MKLFITAFLITINVLWLGVDLMPVAQVPAPVAIPKPNPECEWSTKAVDRLRDEMSEKK
jgi:hypothetical protein